MNELSTEKTMTVKEVAKVLGVAISTCNHGVKKLFPEEVRNGITTYLNEVQVTKLKLYLESHHNLSSTGKLSDVKTNLEKQLLVQQAMNIQQELIEESNIKIKNLKVRVVDLKGELKIAAPKVKVHDKYLSSDDSYSFNAAAKLLSIGRNTLTKLLRDKKILDIKLLPYQRYMKYFKTISTPYEDSNGNTRINSITQVRPSGIVYIEKIICKNSTNQNSLF